MARIKFRPEAVARVGAPARLAEVEFELVEDPTFSEARFFAAQVMKLSYDKWTRLEHVMCSLWATVRRVDHTLLPGRMVEELSPADLIDLDDDEQDDTDVEEAPEPGVPTEYVPEGSTPSGTATG